MVKILTFDIETAPVTAYVWGLYDQTVGLNQIKDDWHLLAWAAKWYGDPPSKTMYMDNRKAKDVTNDKKLVQGLATLLNEADIIITQNGDAFDVKKLNARAILNGLPPIKSCRSTDILKEGRKVFKFTSHKLEYISDKLNKKYKKLKHHEYPGFELWKAVLAGDKKAWNVMKKYTIHDVLATEEAYATIQDWIKTYSLAVYRDDSTLRCLCGSPVGRKSGYYYTDIGKFQTYRCSRQGCKKRSRSRTNLLSAEKKRSILRGNR
jgi:hypothetical protein